MIFDDPFYKKLPVLVILVPGMIKPSGPRASEAAEATEVNEAAEVFKVWKITTESSRFLKSII